MHNDECKNGSISDMKNINTMYVIHMCGNCSKLTHMYVFLSSSAIEKKIAPGSTQSQQLLLWFLTDLFYLSSERLMTIIGYKLYNNVT